MIFTSFQPTTVLYAGIAFALCTSGSIQAAVVNTTGSVETVIQELVDGFPASTTTAEDELNPDQTNFPLIASGQLSSTDLDGQILSLGQGLSEFNDPSRLNQPNPETIALEVACYSNSSDVSYIVTGNSRETRTVLFAGPGNTNLQQEIQFRDDMTREIESQFFLNGAVMLWSTDDDDDLQGLLADLVVTITNENTNTVLFETTLTVDLNNDGELRTFTTGPIQLSAVDINNFLANSVDPQSAGILQGVAQTGTLIILIIPQQSHTYSYTVTADQSLALTVNLDVIVRNVPGGTGIAATFGRPFSNLASFIQDGLPGVIGDEVQKSINDAILQSEAGLGDKPENQTLPAMPLCGVLGMEMMIFGLFFSGLRFVRRFSDHIQ